MFSIHIEDDSPVSGGQSPESSPLSAAGTSRISLRDLLAGSAASAQRAGGSAAFLDINYGKSVGDVQRTGGSAAFLDINYGKSVGAGGMESGQLSSQSPATQTGQLSSGLHMIDGSLYLVQP